MGLPQVVSQEEWLEARRTLLAAEKDWTRRTDALSAERRRLPMVKIENDYRLHGSDGDAGLLDLFDGERQLAIYHFMFKPEWESGCRGCTAAMDELAAGTLAHLRSRDTAFAVVSRAPIEKLDAYKAARGWTFDWYSSHGSDFNYDFHVTLDASVTPILFNYRSASELAGSRDAWVLDVANQPIEISGLSFFVRDGSAVYHTYTTYQRGTEVVIPAYRLLDLSPLGRQEDWEEPKGRAEDAGPADPSFGGGLVPARDPAVA